MTTSFGPIIDRQVAIDHEDARRLPTQSDLEQWVGETLRHIQVPVSKEITVRFVSREESGTLNREYRGKDRPTNVLSFPFDMPAELDIPLLGDLVICHDVVAQEASEQHKALLTHYAHMVVHGTLHLLGHDHIEDNEAERMERLETEILAIFGIKDPYDHPSDHDNGDKRLDA
ncbi:rRNA maturation RNase YbeY [Aidingimonas halophila]|uniref:Endoribonuclease YbeY n=1 Tax=Aidingimonas halophila TaxID=574349 RepID=A0A1H3H4L4_9GAMM|nr:rRNA maturation RNase YbeY [Aidingimonas halophila]GHC36760.1 endoribonuclease YbeY [Aidingimonas halophila]SDY10260.1 probable rRNA maturation factor [Aidingimonas halophila]